jgi:hypothetical protein
MNKKKGYSFFGKQKRGMSPFFFFVGRLIVGGNSLGGSFQEPGRGQKIGIDGAASGEVSSSRQGKGELA